VAAPDFASLAPDEQKAFLMKKGEEVYKTGGSSGVACVTCHQANGEGMKGAFPPLAGAGDAMGDCTQHAGMIINGLQGKIEVLGVEYNGVMPPQPGLSDLEIAAVITYERSSWGNDYGACMPDQVAAAR
jgi:mono/diheme cytochrome c family protein